MAFKRKYLWGGYTLYRYGSPRPVKIDRIFTGEKRRAMVEKVLGVLRHWQLSPFEYEGSTRAGIRSALVLQGYSWARSDLEAEALVAEALGIMGAKRPTWLQGQREYTIPVENCQRCGGPLGPEEITGYRRFCSDLCQDAARVANFEMYQIVTGLARGAAWYATMKKKLPERPCDWCGKMFRPGTLEYYLKTNSCSPECNRALVAARYDRRQCVHCGQWFKPATYHAKFCSIECRRQHLKEARAAAAAERRARRPCDNCGRWFEPRRADARFCGVRCNWQYQNEKDKARRREALASKVCEQCGETFDAATARARFCSVKCRNRFHYVREVEAREARQFVCMEAHEAA